MQLLLFPQSPPRAREETLSFDERLEVLQVLLRGGSPQAICQKQGRDPLDFCRTVEDDAAFRDALRQVRELMTLNVVATVYRSAMEGTSAAQALWLRTFPQGDWAEPASSTSSDSASSDSTSSNPTSFDDTDDAASLTNDALRQILIAFHNDYAKWLSPDAESA